MNNKDIVTMFVVIGLMMILLMGMIVGYQKYEDHYCMNVPFDRMNKKRCGLK